MTTISDAVALIRASVTDPDALATIVAGMDRTELQQLAVRLVVVAKMARTVGTGTEEHPALSLEDWCDKVIKELQQQ